mmetsp:Transcript_10512/g.23327  ORF Transcript_10512/g.23327 Transcript_10512/m.23327 type:complete len:215 (+) Transcript_10512:1600-2244(+)
MRPQCVSEGARSREDPSAAGCVCSRYFSRSVSITTASRKSSLISACTMRAATEGGMEPDSRNRRIIPSAARRFLSLMLIERESFCRCFISADISPRSAWKPCSISSMRASTPSHSCILRCRSVTCTLFSTYWMTDSISACRKSLSSSLPYLSKSTPRCRACCTISSSWKFARSSSISSKLISFVHRLDDSRYSSRSAVLRDFVSPHGLVSRILP